MRENSYESLFTRDYSDLKISSTNQIFSYRKGYSDIYCELAKTKNYLEFLRIVKKLIEATQQNGTRTDQKKVLSRYDKYF